VLECINIVLLECIKIVLLECINIVLLECINIVHYVNDYHTPLAPLERGIVFGLYQHVKEHRRNRLFASDSAKDIKKIPTQPGWIELRMILRK
jgi:hypothetical protein